LLSHLFGGYDSGVRMLGIDVGDRRIGLAVSDPSGTLARPLKTIERSASLRETLDRIVREVEELSADAPITTLVVGLPVRLDGSPGEATERTRRFAEAVGTRLKLPIRFQDERLTSREAESRLAVRERDWKKRKRQLDAAAAAVILQDYLDERGGAPPA
jgi:putative Holliday junction resolvase